jgi:hypothetical protein
MGRTLGGRQSSNECHSRNRCGVGDFRVPTQECVSGLQQKKDKHKENLEGTETNVPRLRRCYSFFGVFPSAYALG